MRSFPLFFIFFLIAGLYSYRNTDSKKDHFQVYVSNFENVLGTSLELKVKAESELIADRAEGIALAEIDRLSKILSGYDPASEFSQWQQSIGRPVRISPELYDVLSLFDHWREKTCGGLNASAQAVSLIWKEAERNQQLPSASALETVVKQSQKMHWTLDSISQTATHLSTVPLMTNTFVKSYIIKAIAEKLRNLSGINAVLVNIGGDIFVDGDMYEDVHIADPIADAENEQPIAAIRVSNRAIATSGNYRRGVEINGQWYSHIVDPRTGKPTGHIISATVVSNSATDAGAMATAFNVLEPKEGIELAKQMSGIEYLVITKEGEHIESDGWKDLELNQAKSSVHISANGHGIVSNLLSPQPLKQLAINIELSSFQERFRRPFVAVWIEDSKKETVRTLALWFNKPKWLPDLKSWYHKNYSTYSNFEQGLSSISSATRPPGEYTLKWDMKDDRGNPLPTGMYTVYIEAAREHGTYQLIRQEIECKNKSQFIQLKGNAEIASASLDYKN